MKVCFLGQDNLPVLAKEYSMHGIGGEQVQQTLLAQALVRLGHCVSMVVYDYGQRKRTKWKGIYTYRSYNQTAGLPVLRFIHPRWTRTWSALREADADLYYVSCAGMHLGLLAMFCRLYKKKFIFRVAHDTDCQPNALLIKYWRDKKLYEYGLRRAHLILVQSAQQKAALQENYQMSSKIARMLVQPSSSVVTRDVDVLWVNNIRPFKRADLILELAKKLPKLRFRMIGGEQVGHADLYKEIESQAHEIKNLEFLGRVPYQDISQHYAGAKIFVNTSDHEGFPNSYLQAWINGTPTVAFFDPDNVISRNELGRNPCTFDEMVGEIAQVLDNETWKRMSAKCREYMVENYDDNLVLGPYIESFEEVLRDQ
jgi:glycosyltransferase involved in cell wall biosynthesis